MDRQNTGQRQKMIGLSGPVLELIERDLNALTTPAATQVDALAKLLDVLQPEAFAAEVDEPGYPI